MSPDATAFAHLVDDGGYPRAVQRFLRGWRASSSRDVELPVEGPVNRVMHSADGHWLACEVAPEGGSRSQIWVVTTDPDDRDARRIDYWPAGGPDGTAELIGWDGTRVAAILTGDDGVGSSCLIDPVRWNHGGARPPLGRQAGRRVGGSVPRAGRAARLPRPDHAPRARPKSRCCHTTRLHHRAGIILDDHSPRRLRAGLEGELTELYQPAKRRTGSTAPRGMCAR